MGAVLIVALAHVGGLGGSFVYDDRVLVEPSTLSGWKVILDAFRLPYWAVFGEVAHSGVPYWRPLAVVALAFTDALGRGAPMGFHLASVSLHLLATVFAFRVVVRLSEDCTTAFFTASIFAVHPVQVEAVAWISAMSDVLYGTLSLVCLDRFLAWRESGAKGPLVGSFLAFGAALLVKEAAILVPLLVLAVDAGLAHGGRLGPRRVRLRPYAAFAAVLVVYWGCRSAVFGDLAAGASGAPPYSPFTTLRAWSYRVELVGDYLRLLLWPDPLTVFHPLRPLWDAGHFASAVAILLAWLASAAFAFRRGLVLIGTMLTLIVVLMAPLAFGMTLLSRYPLAERYLYLACFAFAFALVAGTFAVLPRKAAAVCLGVVVAAYVATSIDRTAEWKNEKSLYVAALEEDPNSPEALWSLGRVLLDEYRGSQRDQVLREASALFDRCRAVAGDPSVIVTEQDRVQCAVGAAWCLLLREESLPDPDYSRAAAAFQAVLEESPKSAEALTGLGTTYFLRGDLEGSRALLERAVRADSTSAPALVGLGRVLIAQGRPTEALPVLSRASELRRRELAYQLPLAEALLTAGRAEQSANVLRRIVEEFGETPEVMLGLGRKAALSGDLDGARAWFERALLADPKRGIAHLYLGKVHAVQGRTEDALSAFQQARSLVPDNFEAHYNAASLLLALGRREEARGALVRAWLVRPGSGAAADEFEEASSRVRQVLLTVWPGESGMLLELARGDHDRGEDDSALEWLRALDEAGTLSKEASDLRAAIERDP